MIGGLAWLRQTLQALPILFGKGSNWLIADNRQHDSAPRLVCKKHVPHFLFFILAIRVKFGFILISERFGTSCDLTGLSCSLIPICWLSVTCPGYKWLCLRSKPAQLTEAAWVLLASLRPLALFSHILKNKAFQTCCWVVGTHYHFCCWGKTFSFTRTGVVIHPFEPRPRKQRQAEFYEFLH